MTEHPALAATDPEIAELAGAEERRQAEIIRLIPSENYVSRAVLEATGTVLTNKYSEGYPHRRYYEGRSAGPRRCSASPTPTSSRTPARPPTSPCTSRSASPGTR
jgi:hypothetical protein